MARSVVITGLGVVTRDAENQTQFWECLRSGGQPPMPPRQFDASRFRAKQAFATDPDALHQLCETRVSAHADLIHTAPTEAQLLCAGHGISAALEAIVQAGLSPVQLQQAGCALATTSGGMMDDYITSSPPPPEGALLAPASAAEILHATFGLQGPFSSFSCACISSLAAISYAVARIRTGDAPIMIAGGSDRMREADFAGFNALRAMDRDRCRPFDRTRKGMMIGDGAAMLVLEDEALAIERGATILARITGMGLSSDSHHITSPNANGLIRAMRQALTQAGCKAQDVTYVNCHGTGTPLNDAAEVQALSEVFDGQAQRPMISSTKGTTGHLLGTAGAVETVATVLALRHGIAPLMATTPSPEETGFPLPLPGVNRNLTGRIAMKNSLGFGGLNASMIMEAPAPRSAQKELPCA
ncbi:beta-ketoacyl-[acyl-carrier-protein] synthase family protein (plasmid) [Aliiroseovarius crassostreae]|uniref:Beta-ketoacyl-[acyl-carrier-protein] synthase family protein n=1 Tax=Aliiroseovarius crassostreae TaxID=154981 RepID=A0A9Q9HBT1_9RHOB|nr:beta-ketoacyl-[acyl-carrier-protein] synthase family protein [Aliiroseovarius crassostreae]UWP97194.1 beta-ketoacyl-[acyl-carrier-protein] synthase family protein [Aliiroseovarius crassostreae]